MQSGVPVNSELSVKEQQLINVIESGVENQRKIAESTGFSLGMTNILLKRLVQKGYIKVIQLNGRTLRYILTPQGFKEKLDRSFDYFVNSIKYLNQVRDRILEHLSAHADRELVCVLGENELSEIVGDVLQRTQVTFLEMVELNPGAIPGDARALVFVCDLEFNPEQSLSSFQNPDQLLLLKPEDFIH